MPIEFIGMIGVRPEGADGAAVHVIGGEIDPAWVRDFSRAHERAGFDKVLVGYTATSAEGFVVASYAASQTERLGFLIAHRPGFVAPTLAALHDAEEYGRELIPLVRREVARRDRAAT